MNPTLRQALQDLLGERLHLSPEGAQLFIADERELSTIASLLQAHGDTPQTSLQLRRTKLDGIGAIDARSGLVDVGAGVRVDRLEQALHERNLSLGPLSPGSTALEVSDWLEGPYAGLRAVPGGRLEPVPIALTCIMPDGLRFVSRPSPRSAAGPDLDALFLGSEGRFGWIARAQLRCFDRPRAERTAVYSFADPGALEGAVLGGIAQGCWLRRVQLEQRGERFLFAAEVIGSPEAVERDLSTLGHEAFSRGGRSSGQVPGPAPSASGVERELSWDEVFGRVRRGVRLTLWRLSLESVIAEGLEEGGQPLVSMQWGNGSQWAALARAVGSVHPERGEA